MENRRLVQLFSLCCLVLIPACGNASPTLVSFAASTATAWPIVITTQAAPTLQAPEILPLAQSDIILKGSLPKRGTAKISLPKLSGEYLIYGPKRGLIQYASLDRMIKGNLIDGYLINELEPVLHTEGLEPIAMLPGQEIPQFVFMRMQGQSPMLDSASIWMTDVFGNLLGAWNASSDSDFACIDPIISSRPYFLPMYSPYYNWIAIDCFHGESHNINLINLKSGESRAFTIKCDIGPAPSSIPPSPNFFWSQIETQFLYRCPYAEYYFISISGDHVVAKQLGNSSGNLRIWSVSPDWKNVVLDMGLLPKTANGTIPGAQIMIADLNCVLNKPVCDSGTLYNLPFRESYDPTKDPVRPDLNLDWSHSGSGLVWTAGGSIGWIDLSSHTNRLFENETTGLLLGLSPDDGWIAFLGTDQNSSKSGLFVMSVKGNNITHFIAEPMNMAGLIKFYGWLTIP